MKHHARNLGNQLLLGTVRASDVVYFPAVGLQPGDQRQIRRHMTRGAPAGQNNRLHLNR